MNQAEAASFPSLKTTDRYETTLDVAPVWAGHPVGFALHTHGDRQTVAFYDARRRMTVGQRHLSESTWRFAVLPETVGWDSHNDVVLAADDDGCLHLSGNMHGNPLVYFRTALPWDIATFERIPQMMGQAEVQVTYPVFFRGPGGAFLFTYRTGYSGNGDQIYNVYHHAARTWRRLLDTPLFDGEGLRNAYLSGPLLGPDDCFHLVWVWRETPDAATNHDPSYARSRDLIHWERSDGTPLPLPITLRTSDVVDPVPVGGGVINGNVRLGFDSQRRPIVSYCKYDEQGNTQIYCARRAADGWHPVQVSDWDWRWDFGGGGTIPFELALSPVHLESAGRLTQSYTTLHHGSGAWVLDDKMLTPLSHGLPLPPYPREIISPESDIPGMQVNWAEDSGGSAAPDLRYVLRWETLGPNRDQPRAEPLPPPSRLRLYALRRS